MTTYNKPARNESEWRALLDSDDPTIIRSLNDWNQLINDSSRNPLKAVPSEAVKHFTESLKFNKGGLAHADYSEIGKHLTYFQFKNIWQNEFGLGDQLFTDYNDKECDGVHTCRPSLNSICTSNC